MTTRNDDRSQGYCGFVVGQHVVCVDDNFRNIGDGAKQGVVFPRAGIVYTVRNLLLSPATGKPALRLVEIRNPKVFARVRFTEAYFRTDRFRPLQKLKVEDFLSTKTPVDGERVPA